MIGVSPRHRALRWPQSAHEARPALLLFLALLGQPASAGANEPLALTHVNIIDVTGGPVMADMTVVITGDRVTAIEKAATIRLPDGTRVVDASDKYLIPGLWDMHVHWYDERFLSLFVANGVTGVRQMFGSPMLTEWRDRAWGPEQFAPRQVIASPIVDGPNPIWPGSIRVGTAEEGRKAVLDIKTAGFDFVKVYNRLPREAYFAIADESKKQGIVVCGHVPSAVSALEASDAGQKSIEHLTGVLRGCSNAADEIAGERARVMAGSSAQTGIDRATREMLSRLVEKLLDTYDEEKAAALFARFARNGTWQCPTLTVNRSLAFRGDADFRNDPRLKYMPEGIKASWRPEHDPFLGTATAEDFAVAKRMYRKQLETVREMRRAGVQFLAGTDVLNAFCFPGFSIHDELVLLVEAGLTPMEALQAATLNPAEYLGMSDSLGAIESGKIADLVLLDANPLDDIGNTGRIAAVVVGGRLIDRAQLDEMLASAERIASRRSLADSLFQTIETQDVEAAIQRYRDLKASQPEAYDFGEDELNTLGYRLLEAKKVAAAIEIFKLNVELYPQSANAHDSLAEAYSINENKALAVEHYKKSLELDPKNVNAVEMLEKLGAR